jgi:hypothetical protein
MTEGALIQDSLPASGHMSEPVTLATNILPLDAFVRSVTVNSQVGHMLLLGAGASITSKVPSAATCIWMWKRAIFLSNHPGLESSFEELSLGSIQDRIQGWIDSQGGYPKAGSPEEYGFYIERCYPLLEDRRAFFQRLVQKAQVGGGYRLTARLAKAGLVRSVWTTNFDGRRARSPKPRSPRWKLASTARTASCGPTEQVS